MLLNTLLQMSFFDSSSFLIWDVSLFSLFVEGPNRVQVSSDLEETSLCGRLRLATLIFLCQYYNIYVCVSDSYFHL